MSDEPTIPPAPETTEGKCECYCNVCGGGPANECGCSCGLHARFTEGCPVHDQKAKLMPKYFVISTPCFPNSFKVTDASDRDNSTHHYFATRADAQAEADRRNGQKAQPESERQCILCRKMVSDWVDPDWARGRICRSCESLHEPKEPSGAANLSSEDAEKPVELWQYRSAYHEFRYDRKPREGVEYEAHFIEVKAIASQSEENAKLRQELAAKDAACAEKDAALGKCADLLNLTKSKSEHASSFDREAFVVWEEANKALSTSAGSGMRTKEEWEDILTDLRWAFSRLDHTWAVHIKDSRASKWGMGDTVEELRKGVPALAAKYKFTHAWENDPAVKRELRERPSIR